MFYNNSQSWNKENILMLLATMFKFCSLNYETHAEFFVNWTHKIKLALLYNVTGILPLLSRSKHCLLIFNCLYVWFRYGCFWLRRNGRHFSKNIVILCESSFNFRFHSVMSNFSIRIAVILEVHRLFIIVLSLSKLLWIKSIYLLWWRH
jgi:hypothetical protein